VLKVFTNAITCSLWRTSWERNLYQFRRQCSHHAKIKKGYSKQSTKSMLLRFLHKHLDLNAEWKLHLSFPQKNVVLL